MKKNRVRFPHLLADSPTANLLWKMVASQVKLRYKRNALNFG